MPPSISDTLVVYGNNTHALHPSNPSEQWKLSLQEVKLLYLRRQYKQCAAKSMKLLRKVDHQLHAIHKAFLHYYSAISYEALGRGAHNYSNNRLPLLNLARDNFTACKSSLAVALSRPVKEKQHPPSQQQRRKPNKKREHVLINDRRKTYPATSPTKIRCDAPILVENAANHAALSPEPAQESATTSPSSTMPRQGPPEKKKKLMPSPLRIHKVYHNGCFQDQLIEYNPPSLPPPMRPLPELPPEANQRPLPSVPKITTTHEPHAEAIFAPLFRPLAPQFYRHSIGFSTTTPTAGSRLTIYQQQANNSNSMFPLPQNSPLIPLITSLSTQLDANVKYIGTLISKTLELQRVRNAKKNSRLTSFWSFTPTYDDDNVIASDTFYHHDDHNNNATNGTTATATTTINGHPTTPLPTNNNNLPSSTTTTPNTGTTTTSNSTTSPPPPLSSSSSSPSPTDETRPQRIARLKADGWMTVGLRSRKRSWKGVEHYERVCNEALAELYNANGSGSGRVN
ncbi:hypothetical protein EMCG_00773 [[Emmonsia] crescens]|uniref:Uncharacterized protein n=1 Tax=[Emmonsia] crescens TaxID=73230 RepID=A0A0G2HPS0_9EURO|nr:hypothetical protein EMCG_00773 [Emmonsia crescens UAMH 3008]